MGQQAVNEGPAAVPRGRMHDDAGGLVDDEQVVVLVAVALAALVVYFARHAGIPGIWVPAGMLAGGAVGNIVDRVRDGAVTDFLKLPNWPAFNLADVAITLGVVALLVVVERDARRRPG